MRILKSLYHDNYDFLYEVDLFDNGETITIIANKYIELNNELAESIRDNYYTKVQDIIYDFYKTYIEKNNIETPLEEFISKCRNNLEYVNIHTNYNGYLNVTYGIKVILYNPDHTINIPLAVPIILDDEGTHEFIEYGDKYDPAPLFIPFIKE